MISSRPYLLRAIYEWLVDCELTPYIVVDTTVEGVSVPEEYTEGGRIVLSISPRACRGLIIDNQRIILTTRFGGKPYQLSFPPSAVLAIYAKENGRGMMFPNEDLDGGDDGDAELIPEKPASPLSLAKSDVSLETTKSPDDSEPPKSGPDGSSKIKNKPPNKPTQGKKPFLKVIK